MLTFNIHVHILKVRDVECSLALVHALSLLGPSLPLSLCSLTPASTPPFIKTPKNLIFDFQL